MNIRNGFLVSLAIALAAFVFSYVLSASMPDVVPMHWNAAGQVDGYGSKSTGLYFLPGMMLGLAFLMLALPKLSPRKFEVENFESTYATVFVLVMAMMGVLHVVIVRGAAGQVADVTKTMMIVLMLFFAFMGNWMGKVRRNFYMGIRTPWTLADERVWDVTHRVASRVWFFGGLIGAVLAVFLPFGVTFGGFMAMCFYPVVLSYFIYRRLAA